MLADEDKRNAINAKLEKLLLSFRVNKTNPKPTPAANTPSETPRD